ncbi:SCD domain-containing protein [Meloidogyne graminicola]|uniref:SCD domain-containing protein n=1 Tax=Meloidogyne graminicola TaxID=189291 RepID=A0A8T0A1A6_9BILA|nr:SCD domain-containing protein [Meloidogyne graminicola]
MQSTELAVHTNTYSLRARKQVSFDRDYSPPEQPVKKRAKVQTIQKKSVAAKKAPVSNAVKFATPIFEDPYYVALKSGKSANSLVEKWIREYDNSPDQAIAQFLQTIIASCGCSAKLDANMVHNMEMNDIISRISDHFDEESGDYPLMMTAPQWKRFRNNFGDFITIFVCRCKNNILFDVTLMDSLIQLLVSLSQNAIRAFRHTATFVAMKLSSAIVDVAVELEDFCEKNTKQLETERLKISQTGSNERMELLLQSRADFDSKLEELTAMTQFLFRSVFALRYRDIVPDIRIICLTELGNWMRAYPASFLNDSYLKYYGWCISDKVRVPEVRLCCLNTLLPLYDNADTIVRLELFTSKFKNRLVSMVRDTEVEAATKACQLLVYIYRAFPGLLTLENCALVYEMIYCNNRQLAVSAASFVKEKLFSPSPQSSSDMEFEWQSQIELIKQLVTFYKDGGVHYHPAYLVDSFIDICPMLRDWASMVSILIENEVYEDDSQLISIMSAAVRQAATGEHPPNRIVISIRRGPGAGTEKKDLRLLHEERVRISEVFIPTLPRMLLKFIADEEKVLNLLDIFLHFDLEIYSAGRFEQALSEFMQNLCRIVEQYSNEDILGKVSEIFQFINGNMAIAQFTETTRVRIIDGVVNQLRLQMQQYLQQYSDPIQRESNEHEREEEEALLLSNFRRMVALTRAIDIPSRWDLFDLTFSLVNQGELTSTDLLDRALLLCYQSLMWDAKRLNANFHEIKEKDIDYMRKRRDQFIKVSSTILRENVSGVLNVLEFDPDHPAHSLAIKLNQETIFRLSSFVIDNVFYEDINNSSEINIKRSIFIHYVKLIIYGVIPVLEISPLLRFFIKYYTDFGDIFKLLLQKCRELDKVMTAKAIVQSLVNAFDELKNLNQLGEDGEEFQSLRELGKKFALSFGVDNIKNREALATIHHVYFLN